MNTASTAPALFKRLGQAALQAAADVKKLDRQLLALGSTITNKVDPALRRTGSAFKTLASSNVSGFATMGRAAGGFSRTVTSVARQSVSSLHAVTLGARQSASAFNAMAAAANRIPRTIRPSIQPPTGGGGGMGYTGALMLAGAGAAAGGTLMSGIRGASDVQNQTLQAAIAMGRMGANLAGTTANMSDFKDVAFSMSTMTGQNLADSMGVIAAMSSAGVSPDKLKKIYKPIAQFTDILHFGKDHMEYAESAKMGAGIVHEMRFFNPGDTAYGLGRIAQLGYLSPHGISQVVTQVRRMAPTLENILPGTNRDKATTITEMAAWADRMGNLPFAGSAISQMVTQMMAPRSDRVKKSLVDLGIWQGHEVQGKRGAPKMVLDQNLFYNKHLGQFDVMGALKRIALTYKDAPDKGPVVMALLQNTQNAARIMQALSSKESLTAYDQIISQRKAMGEDPVQWMNRVQLQLMGELSSQTQMLTSNFQTLSAAIGNSMIPDLTKIVTNLQLMTASAAQFFMQHPGAAKAAAIGLGGVAAAGAMAAIAVGGYITAGVFSHILPGLIGRLGIGHTLPHLLPAGGAMARLGGLGVTGIAGRVGASVLGVSGISKVVGLLRTIPLIATIFDHIGGAAKLLALPLVIVAKSLGFLAVQAVLLGVKIVSGVGDIVMLVQAIHFFFDHAKNVGWLLGKAARWLVDNVPKILSSWGPRLFDAMKSLVGYMLGALDPRNWVGAFQNFLGGITSGFNANRVGPPSPIPKPAPGPPRTPASASQIVPSWMGGAARGGYTTAEGLAYLHKGEVVVNHRTTRALDRLTAPGHSGSNVVNAPHITLHYNAPAGESEVVHRRRSKQMNRDLAQAVAAELSRCAELGMRSGGAIPQMADASHHAFLAGVPS